MRRPRAGIAVAAVAVLVAMILAGGHVLASGGAPAAPVGGPAPAATGSPDDDCTVSPQPCGNEFARAVHAWVACKAEKGKAACQKPTPPGRAIGHTKHADGPGHGRGRAHAPGQVRQGGKHEHPDADADEDEKEPPEKGS